MLTERLLNISGEDVVSISRKYREDWTGGGLAVPPSILVRADEVI